PYYRAVFLCFKSITVGVVKALAVIFFGPINLGGDLTIYNGSIINRTDGKVFYFSSVRLLILNIKKAPIQNFNNDEN
ncbi:hypothetical protein, partial [Staphylococcus aureus]